MNAIIDTYDPTLFDEDGLLRDFSSWSQALAAAVARDTGIATLTDEHWKLIHALRGQYAESGAAPVMHLVCRHAGVDRDRVNELFGYCLIAWRIAGLPNPGEEAKSYLSNM